jgi:hypothetical protein
MIHSFKQLQATCFSTMLAEEYILILLSLSFRMMWNNMTPEQKEKFKEEWKNRSRRWGYRSRDSETEVEQPGAGSQ